MKKTMLVFLVGILCLTSCQKEEVKPQENKFDSSTFKNGDPPPSEEEKPKLKPNGN